MLITDCYTTGVWNRGEVEMRWREKDSSDKRERERDSEWERMREISFEIHIKAFSTVIKADVDF